MYQTKVSRCDKCQRLVKGYFVTHQHGILGVYAVYKFNCIHDDGADVVFCNNFQKRFRIAGDDHV